MTFDWVGGFLHARQECPCGASFAWWGIDTPPYAVFDPRDEAGAAEVVRNLLALEHVCTLTT